MTTVLWHLRVGDVDVLSESLKPPARLGRLFYGYSEHEGATIASILASRLKVLKICI